MNAYSYRISSSVAGTFSSLLDRIWEEIYSTRQDPIKQQDLKARQCTCIYNFVRDIGTAELSNFYLINFRKWTLHVYICKTKETQDSTSLNTVN